ncbi:MAG: hypothetical protein O2U61_04170 [Candidatus Bathyarchaeota archaeon]|nr:hypothetical protein [Candidatus Bathyarchaeota archaeon]
MGDFEAEIDSKEVQKVKDQVDYKFGDSELSDQKPEVQENIDNITVLLDSDHILALAKLRIELKKNINKLYRLNMGYKYNKNDRNMPLGKTVHELALREVLSKDISNPLREILYFCNRAIHGDEVTKKDAKKIVNSGISIYKHVISLGQEYIAKPNEVVEIDTYKVDKYKNSKYRVVTIIPYTEKPVKNVRVVNQEELDELLDGYGEYAEFIVEIKVIE